MLGRPMMRMGQPGLLGVAARTAVVAGTATAVVGGVSRHQQNKAQQAAEAQAYEQQQNMAAMQAAAPPMVAPPPPPAASGPADTITQLERLGQLKQQGILTEAEFAAEKAKILGM
jgi:hypothetical protein